MFLEIANAATASSGANQVPTFAENIASLLNSLITQIPSWIAGFIVLVLAFIAARIAKAAVESRISDQVDEEHQEILVLSGRITNVSVITIGATVALKIAGIDLTTILAAVAFGVGFALRAFIANFFAGVYLLVSKQFAIGDFVQIGGTIGKVEEIQSRATILKTYDGYKVIVPNSDIFTKQVISLTTNPLRRIKIPLYIGYDEDISYAMQIALRTIKKHPKVQKHPKPTIIVNDYGDSTIDLIARFWVGSKDGWFTIRSEVAKMLWEAFMKAGIVVPYNIYHIENEQDTAEWVKEFGEIEKTEKQKMIEARAKKRAMRMAAMGQAGGAAQLGTVVPQPQSAQMPQASQTATTPEASVQVQGQAPQVAPTTPPTAADAIPLNPPGVSMDLEDLDHNG